MKLRKPDPFTCTHCGFIGNCSPCFFREVDYKTRTGLCKKCARDKPRQSQKTEGKEE